MDRLSPPPSDEAEPLNTYLPRGSTEAIELPNHSDDASRTHSPPLASDTYSTYHSRESGGSGLADSPVDIREQRHLRIRHQDQASFYSNDNYPSDSRVQKLWLWEVFSIIIATLAFSAIVTVLVLCRDRPVPKWPLAITINALIAIFTAIFKASLMMPIAECISQLKWLWYQKPRPLGHMEQWDLASRGELFCYL